MKKASLASPDPTAPSHPSGEHEAVVEFRKKLESIAEKEGSELDALNADLADYLELVKTPRPPPPSPPSGPALPKT
jgi:hypothetical protein